MSIVLYCNGYKIVSPFQSRSVVSSGVDSKCIWPYDEKWWKFSGTNPDNPAHWVKKWETDEIDISGEIEQFLLTGSNSFFSP